MTGEERFSGPVASSRNWDTEKQYAVFFQQTTQIAQHADWVGGTHEITEASHDIERLAFEGRDVRRCDPVVAQAQPSQIG
jgi:hypothetical protein